MTFDDTYRVGRCNVCHGKPAFAWKADTGLRLDDGMRCPKCRHSLDRTSREARYMREFNLDELLWVFEDTRQALLAQVERSQKRMAEREAMPEDEDGAKHWLVEMERETQERLWKNYYRVDDGYRRWMFSDDGSAEHDAAVKSGR